MYIAKIKKEVFMPYENLNELPKGVKNNLPTHAKEIYLAAFNSALETYKNPEKRRDNASVEEIAHRVAWSSVEKQYTKDSKTGQWLKKP